LSRESGSSHLPASSVATTGKIVVANNVKDDDDDDEEDDDDYDPNEPSYSQSDRCSDDSGSDKESDSDDSGDSDGEKIEKTTKSNSKLKKVPNVQKKNSNNLNEAKNSSDNNFAKTPKEEEKIHEKVNICFNLVSPEPVREFDDKIDSPILTLIESNVENSAQQTCNQEITLTPNLENNISTPIINLKREREDSNNVDTKELLKLDESEDTFLIVSVISKEETTKANFFPMFKKEKRV
jgi:hypothetical protein